MTREPAGERSGRWVVRGERPIYESEWVQLVLVDVEPPNGQRFEHHVVRLPHAAVAVVLDQHDRVLLLRRHRFIADTTAWELPGGIVGAGEDPAATAAREVEEETGWRPGPMKHLVSFQAAIGGADAPHDVFVAHGAERVAEPSDAEEVGQVGWVPLSSVLNLIDRGEIVGSSSLVGLLHVLASHGSESPAR